MSQLLDAGCCRRRQASEASRHYRRPFPARRAWLAAYAAGLANNTDPDECRHAAATRLLDYYTHAACTAARLLHPHRCRIRVPLAALAVGATPEHLEDDRAALAWLTTEHPALLTMLRFAADEGFDAHTWQLAWALNTFLNRRGHWYDQAGAWQSAAIAADRLTDPVAAASAYRELAWANTRQGNYPQAETRLRRAMELCKEAGDQAGQADTHLGFAYFWERQRRPELALRHAQQAVTLSQAADDRPRQTHALKTVGRIHALCGDHAAALIHCQQAVTSHRQAGDRWGEANAWDNIGEVYHRLGQLADALDCYKHALALVRDLGDRHYQATILTSLGSTHEAAGHPAAANIAFAEATKILIDLKHPDVEAVRTKLELLDQRGADTPC